MAVGLSGLNVNPAKAKEETMLRRIIDRAKHFYQNPENRQAYEDWLKKKEANNNATNYINP